ncbi:lysozyme inhibitor LprI family protein [Desulfovibrio cuneatus]|uniref:lysozyme inhibitor LprI family protein n=1 Tax=Desulfovibrio cuneatus TaxID=159728 RepID=UPI0004829759|nr:lysozyme inhibitor LprI family protein [Desulfovibrio cuneatus]
MRPIQLIFFGLIMYVATPALAASTDPVLGERALREECSAFPQAEMHVCLAQKAESSEKALRQAEDEVARLLSKWDEDKQYVNQAKEKLATSNKNFSNYRDSQCQFLASLSGGGAGNAHEIRRLACIAELNNRRTQQLRDAVSDLPLQ